MDRTNLARAAAVSAGILVLIVAPAAVGDPATPVTITFTGTGTAPLLCGSRPDITSHGLTRGQTIILANRTGVEASIDVGTRDAGAKDPRTVAPSSSISVELAVGEHVLRMVPKCLLVGEVGQAVVVVAPGPPAGSGSSGQALGSPATSDPTAALLSASAAGAAPPGESGAPEPGSGPAVGDDPQLTAVPVEPPSDERGTRLLAIIAAICVLGVTAGIIRAIVTHRTRASLRTISTK